MPRNRIPILIIDDNSSYALPLLRTLSAGKKYEIYILVLSAQPPGHFRYSRYIEKVFWKREFRENDFPEITVQYINRSGARLIIPSGERITKLFARFHVDLEKAALMHPVADVSTLEMVTDKWELNLWLKENGFPYAMNTLVEKGKIISDDLGIPDFPMLWKPVNGSGGAGIMRLQNQDGLERQLSLHRDLNNRMILQEIITGYDIDISLFAVKGRILFHTIQMGIIRSDLSFSTGIEFIMKDDFLQLGERLIQKLRYTGIAHLDFRYNREKDQYVLIDFNARYWSTLPGSRAAGVNFPVLIAAHVLGQPGKYPGYSTGNFYTTRALWQAIAKNMVSRQKYPIRLKHSQLYYNLADPAPNLTALLDRIIASVKIILPGSFSRFL